MAPRHANGGRVTGRWSVVQCLDMHFFLQSIAWYWALLTALEDRDAAKNVVASRIFPEPPLDHPSALPS
jgi:hypothetical protein